MEESARQAIEFWRKRQIHMVAIGSVFSLILFIGIAWKWPILAGLGGLGALACLVAILVIGLVTSRIAKSQAQSLARETKRGDDT